MMMLLTALNGVALSATPLPYAETLGDVTNSGCDAQWDGDCETGWSGWGATDSLELVQNVTDSSIYGVKITPGTSFWNGFWRDFQVTGGKVLEWELDAILLDNGTADIAVRVVFKDSGGTTVDTQTFTKTGATDYGTYTAWFAVPTTAVTADVFMGAKNPGAAGDEVVISSTCFSGCNSPPQGPFGREIENMPDLQCDAECPECDISCPSGKLVNACFVDEDCEVHNNECYCEDSEEEYQNSTDWN